MNTEKRIIAFAKLGDRLRDFTSPLHSPSLRQRRTRPLASGEGGGGRGSSLQKAIKKSSQQNGWFTEENILFAIRSIGEMLREEKIRKWISKYPEARSQKPEARSQKPEARSQKPEARNQKPEARSQKPEARRVGVIMAGNIPLVGFHDFLCVLFSGNIFVGKLSSEDEFLLPAAARILCEIEPEFKLQIHFASSRVLGREEASAFIATGSNNSARYFEYYFRNIPHIIRKNRNSVAVLDGTETKEDLRNLGKDIFQYFGLGCRNVSKIFIPQNYDLTIFLSAIVGFGKIIHHNKYFNNYTYYRSIYLLNKEKFLDNGFLLLKESPFPSLPPKESASGLLRESRTKGKGESISLSPPVATLYYERYESKKELSEKLEMQKENIQCVVSNHVIPFSLERIGARFGQTQSPELWDYADGVDTMEFLFSLRNTNQYECY